MSNSDRQSEEFVPVHYLAKKPREEGWNLFIFYDGAPNAQVCAGLNLRKYPITVSTLYRWLHLAMNSSRPLGLFPVQIKKPKGSILCYKPEKSGPMLPQYSDKLATPGDYVGYNLDDGSDIAELTINSCDAPEDKPLKPYQYSYSDYSLDADVVDDVDISKEDTSDFTPFLLPPPAAGLDDSTAEASDGKSFPPVQNVPRPEPKSDLLFLKSLEPLAIAQDSHPTLHYMDKFSPVIQKSVEAREQKCYVTGALAETEKLDVIWIFPPSLGSIGHVVDQFFVDDVPFNIVSNVIQLREDLIAPFKNNSFGIDVDDNYRIVVFKEWGDHDVALPSHIKKPEGPNEWFLRQHFRWCLKVYFCGGDISKEYSQWDLFAFMEGLGFVERDDELLPPDDPLWFTKKGGMIWEGFSDDRFGISDEKNPFWEDASS